MNSIPYIKNLYTDPSNKLFNDLRICTKAMESCGMTCSSLYVATPWQVEGGGVIGVMRLEDQIRNPPVVKLKGHTSNILDLAFNPCYSEVIASSSEDMTIRIWEVAQNDDKTREIKDPLCILKGHKKKVNIIDWNPINYYILSSTSFDCVINIWDIENEKKAFQINMPKKLTSLKWNIRGTLLVGTCLNKYLHIIDPRKKEICSSFYVHNGGKSARSIWIDGIRGNDDYVLSTGFSKNNMREIKLWDLKNTSSPLVNMSIDNASAPLLPHYDESIGIFYLIGKGDGNCRYYQQSEGIIRKLGEYKSCLPFKSFGFLPKQVCDIYKCEIGRVYKNENNTSIRPISFFVPRKNSTIFQEDLYPPIIMHNPKNSSKHWIDGIDLNINRISIKDLTESDLRITKKFKRVPYSCIYIYMYLLHPSKRGSIIRKFTRKFTFFKKSSRKINECNNNEDDNSINNYNYTSSHKNKNSFDSSKDSLNFKLKSFKVKGILNDDGEKQFYNDDGDNEREKSNVMEDEQNSEYTQTGKNNLDENGEDSIYSGKVEKNRNTISKCCDTIRNIKLCLKREKI
ncbi:coronin, putative [Plasmodium malariae]|uniref:Coronin n=1 Tax=Plasmodium malariae TaxID=5858 RepID=A0A1C3L3L4_PLAMA|nr:coronin, putative [Plasmodium malariae]